jgi:hypothetical protein
MLAKNCALVHDTARLNCSKRTRPYDFPAELVAMLHHLGILLQICAMTFLPLVILYQLNFGFRLIAMPVCTVIGFAVFWIGTQLREKT